jgi:hypothetical protein
MNAPLLRPSLRAFVLLAALCLLPQLAGATPVPGEFLLKFAFPVNPGSWYPNGQGYLMTGIPSIDTLNVQYHVTDMVPLFYPLSNDPEILADQEAVGLDRVFKAIMDPIFDPEVAAADYDTDPTTDYAEANEVNEGDGPHQYLPNDVYFGGQWSLHNTGQTGGTPDADIDGPEAWMIQRGDSSIVIAIVDMGVNYNLQDLKQNIWINPAEDLDNDRVVMDPDDDDDIDNDNNGKVDDFIGWDCVGAEDNNPIGDQHGSWVAHVLNGVTDNDSLMASISMNCKLMIVKAGSGSGSGSLQNDDCAQAIEYAARNGADVINMSWSNSGSTESAAIRDACVFAYRRDCILVASAGNSGSTTPRAPAHWEDSYVDVIAVAGTDHNDQRYNHGGHSSNYGSWIDVSAPSEYVFTVNTVGDTVRVNGTSFGAPIVSGIAALIRSAYPGMSVEDVIDQIENTCDDIGLSGMGSGRVNAHAALKLNLWDWTPDEEISTHGDEFSSHDTDVAVSGDTVHVVWAQTPPFFGFPEVYYSRSTDDGETWSVPVILSTNDGITSTSPSVAAAGGEVYVAWLDAKWGSNTDISYRYSSDYGATFGSEKNATSTSGTAGSGEHDIALADSVAHLVWVEHPAGSDNCYYRALESGMRRGGSFNVSSVPAGYNAIHARVDAETDYVQVVWEQDGGGQTWIRHRRNTSKGDSTSWSNQFTVRQAAIGTIGNPDVATSFRYTYVVWDEDEPSTKELWVRRNVGWGNPLGWAASSTRATPTTDGRTANEPRMTAEGDEVDIVWNAYSGANFEVYHAYSVNYGVSFRSPQRVTFNAGDSYNPSVECTPSNRSNEANYLYLVWHDGSFSTGSTRTRFKRRDPFFITRFQHDGNFDFDDHDLSGWNTGQTGGNTISISPGPNVSSPNSLLMNCPAPGYAWAETPPHSLDLTEPHWLTTWLYLDGVVNDDVIVMDNQEIRLELVTGSDLVSGTGLPIEALAPYTWYLIECYATPSALSYDVYVNQEFRATVPFETGPPTQTIRVGDVTDGPVGYGTVRWDNLGFEGLQTVGVGPFPPSGRISSRLPVDVFPNPFSAGTNIVFTLPITARTFAGSPVSEGQPFAGAMVRKVTVQIFDPRGRLVRSVEDSAEEGRAKRIVWDGRDAKGREVTSGAYLVLVRSEAVVGATKVILVK